MSYDVTKIETKFSGLVGLRQPDDPNFFVINPTNLASSSGLFVNDNPFAKLDLLNDTQDYDSIDEIQFNTKLTRVMNNSINFRQIQNNFLNRQPPFFMFSRFPLKLVCGRRNIYILYLQTLMGSFFF